MALSRQRLDRQVWWSALAVIFVVGRRLYGRSGIDFDHSTLGVFWQFVDPALLREELWQSLWYLHSQPPLFNLFLGGVLRFPEPWPGTVFEMTFAVLGLFCGIAVFELAVRLGAGPRFACLFAAVWISHPSFVLTERWLMYDLPTAACLLFAALCLERAWRRDRFLDLHLFFWAILALCGRRSFFHPAFFWLCTAGLGAAFWLGRRHRLKRLMSASLVPMLLLGAWQLKNVSLFGQLGTSSWFGMTLMRIAGAALTDQELAELRRSERWSEEASVIDVPPFSALEAYPEDLRVPSPMGVSVLSDELKSTGAVSFHHWAYLRISKAHGADAWWIIRHRPDVYGHGLAKAWYNFFQPQSRMPHVAERRALLHPAVERLERLLYGEVPGAVSYGGNPKSLFLIPWLLVPAVWLWALGRVVWGVRKTRFDGLEGPLVVSAFMVGVAVYVAAVGTCFEVWENQRFRFYIDGFTVALLAVAAERIRRRMFPSSGKG